MFSYVILLFFIGWSKIFSPSIKTLESFISTFGIYLLLIALCASSSNAKTKSLFTPWKLDLTKSLKFVFCADNSGFDRYLFQLIILLKPDFDCCNNYALSRIDKVATGT